MGMKREVEDTDPIAIDQEKRELAMDAATWAFCLKASRSGMTVSSTWRRR